MPQVLFENNRTVTAFEGLDVQPKATPAQPDAPIGAVEASELEELFGKSGEPTWNRTAPP
jgi:hypothetical protein